ncbi:uncharacterized protein KY384_000842 [Bacidia gigantensis]|uniref:uncharacterized protein n=1 Tax=Bacidia gigantensis TaxID=2732470 RepID=UPI001D059B51|nr:uncharacterized protein KY384_000842 [Bacidia gigantensis]KAG8534000.1 hypothetical protein KY384_000842 [Bacidia gigantensis]
MANKFLIPFLVGMMLLTGVCNTLLTKYQDLVCVGDCDTPKPRRFSQPVIQTAQMFIGEAACWLIVLLLNLYNRLLSRSKNSGYKPLLASTSTPPSDDDEPVEDLRQSLSSLDPHTPIAKSLLPDPTEHRRELNGWKILLLALPACCDLSGTTLMNVGLLFVAASIYQMTRGALVLFVGLFSVVFLRRRLQAYQWSSLFIVVLGVAVVGLAGAIQPNPQAQPETGADGNPTLGERGMRMVRGMGEEVQTMAEPSAVLLTILGILAIAGAQVFTASQFVLEEWILENYALEPLKVVGWEGTFGFIVTIVAMIILHLTVGRTEQGKNGYFDAVEGWREITEYRSIAVSSVLIMISIGGFNFFGLSITRSVSATARSIIDTCRTLFIWIVSLGLGWETFKWLQIVGFALLVYGTFLFNDIVQPPMRACARRKREELLSEQPIEHN